MAKKANSQNAILVNEELPDTKTIPVETKEQAEASVKKIHQLSDTVGWKSEPAKIQLANQVIRPRE